MAVEIERAVSFAHLDNNMSPRVERNEQVAYSDSKIQGRQGRADPAGVAWGPVSIGPYNIWVTNPHWGWAGPKFQNALHTNVRVNQNGPKNGHTDRINLHVVPYTHGSQRCWYIYDSISKTVILDTCLDDWGKALVEAENAANNFIENFFKDKNLFEEIVLIAGLIIFLDVALPALLSAGAIAIA